MNGMSCHLRQSPRDGGAGVRCGVGMGGLPEQGASPCSVIPFSYGVNLYIFISLVSVLFYFAVFINL